ncbi:presenilin family intramembrane aspartyl protease [Thermoflexus sp.]|uniref:presenilin family intramembrane aspartyl protease n=1 Tax=Thermoflexus sp. TaxID=1969742 RepID=UPI0025F1C5F6|nr:presenilin family intramembrane aspartyl protease [Thermoflexus sp.]MDW8181165.1 presenilin family intramembrane aspartyl protease [Anaerolineae bacterium]MCS6964532.1 presenilin family intramembrane aspartyl protease [Thermoflexus sp.]MCS7351707.1 presenilin family intramembrane aspartyl protease [Thermoflexus sp.]MCX7691378.1 presenilin family intramembrane aspartyl protease [Thermoflexus sp.]MDW8185713.1 presenilin family intramembrane aspartyl protease [Anaerolineae bacterium]
MDLLQQLWAWLADPNVAYLLLVGGILAAVAAWSIPGTGLGEGLAVLMLGLALIGLLRLPISAAGLLLILLGALLFLSELYFQSGGYLGLSGALALGLGGMFLLPPGTGQQIAPVILIGTTLTAAAASFGLAFLVRELGHRPPLQTPERLIGAEGLAQTDLDPEGTVWVQGETWTARAAEGRIAAGERVRVLAVQGLRLRVTRVELPSPSSPTPAPEVSPPPSDPAGPAALGGGMALLLAVHWLGFLASGLPSGDPSLRTDPSLTIARQLSEELAARPVGEQMISTIPTALGWIALGLLLAFLLVRLRGSQRILKALVLGMLGFILFFSLRLLLVSLMGPPPTWILPLLAGLAFGLVLWWHHRPGWVALTLMGLLVCSAAAAYLGHLWTPMATAALLSVMMLYDALAVYVSGHMQRLAEWAIRERIPLMFLIPLHFPPSRSGSPTLMLGFGDAVLPAILTFSALRIHPTPWPAVGTLIGILLGYAVLVRRFLAKGKSHAGLPFLAGGALSGYGLGNLLEQAFG